MHPPRLHQCESFFIAVRAQVHRRAECPRKKREDVTVGKFAHHVVCRDVIVVAAIDGRFQLADDRGPRLNVVVL